MSLGAEDPPPPASFLPPSSYRAASRFTSPSPSFLSIRIGFRLDLGVVPGITIRPVLSMDTGSLLPSRHGNNSDLVRIRGTITWMGRGEGARQSEEGRLRLGPRTISFRARRESRGNGSNDPITRTSCQFWKVTRGGGGGRSWARVGVVETRTRRGSAGSVSNSEPVMDRFPIIEEPRFRVPGLSVPLTLSPLPPLFPFHPPSIPVIRSVSPPRFNRRYARTITG